MLANANINLRVKKGRKNLKRNLFIFSLLIVPMLHFLVFWVYINARTISLAFYNWNVFENVYEFVGLDNFKEQFRMFKERPETMKMFLNAFRAIPINVACLGMAVIVGYAFSKHIYGERVFRVIFYLPSMISIVILTLCYRYMFAYSPGMLQGPAAEVLRFLGVNYNGWETALDEPAVISRLWWLVSIFCVWASAGINIILVSSAMSRIPEEVKESAKLDGVGFWRELFQIHIPLIMPTISVFLVNSMMAVSAFYIQPMLILGETGPRSAYSTVGWYMFNMTGRAQNGDMPLISTVGFIMTVAVSILVIVVKKVTDKITPDVDF
ncbi:MAG: sugar ABC transporter permease [Clostridia bacterium]|nr:sugar ABC transporter permease [Clostridia bacterium]